MQGWHRSTCTRHWRASDAVMSMSGPCTTATRTGATSLPGEGGRKLERVSTGVRAASRTQREPSLAESHAATPASTTACAHTSPSTLLIDVRPAAPAAGMRTLMHITRPPNLSAERWLRNIALRQPCPLPPPLLSPVACLVHLGAARTLPSLRRTQEAPTLTPPTRVALLVRHGAGDALSWQSDSERSEGSPAEPSRSCNRIGGTFALPSDGPSPITTF